MTPSDYVSTYLQLWCWVNDTFTAAAVRKYLQKGKGDQSPRAQAAHSQLVSGLNSQLGLKSLPPVFEIQGDTYTAASLERVYEGKGAPNEIQDAIWLVSLCGLVSGGTLAQYCDNNLGIDCGGFVANYWGMGRPTPANLAPTGADGFKPRYIWKMCPEMRRPDAGKIEVGDAAVFFQDVKFNDPDIEARPNSNGKGYDRSTGSQAFHIGLVASQPVPVGNGQLSIDIADSSGSAAPSGGNGVKVKSRTVTAKVEKGLVYFPDGDNRIYLTGRRSYSPPYPPNSFGA
jgi:hypothetical protein